MKKFSWLTVICLVLGWSVGCGSGLETDASKATPPMEPENHTKDIEEAMKSGKIDPATYGKQ